MADFDRPYSSSYSSRHSTDQNPRRSTDYNSYSYEYNGRLDIVPRPRSPPVRPPLPAPPPQRSATSVGCFGDPEMKRKRRVASYKAYSVEGKMKASIRNGFRWIKVKCSEIIHGW